MSEEKLKYCVYCGAEIDPNKIYCPECGKLIVKAKSSKPKGKETPSRKCPGCGSIINSSVLKQCPICNTELKAPPPQSPSQTERNQGFIFTNKKFEPEQKFVIKKESWSFREGINVFSNSILLYIVLRLLFLMLMSFILNPDDSLTMNVDIYSILLSQIPEILLCAYPIFYIYSKNHSITKLGFNLKSKFIYIALFIGILGGVGIYFVDLFSDQIINLLYNLGLGSIFDIISYSNEYTQILKTSNILLILLLVVLLSLTSIANEILFRGVLHNTLKQRLGEDISGRILVIFLVALIYSVIFLFFSFPGGLYFFVFYFLLNLILGLLYEYNGNIMNSIVAYVFYNVLAMVLLFLL